MSDEAPQWIKDMEPKRESIVDKVFPRHVCGLQGFGAPGDVCEACVSEVQRGQAQTVGRLPGVAGLWTADDLVRLALVLSNSKMTLGQLLDEMQEAARHINLSSSEGA